jgi:hypothetical protein
VVSSIGHPFKCGTAFWACRACKMPRYNVLICLWYNENCRYLVDSLGQNTLSMGFHCFAIVSDLWNLDYDWLGMPNLLLGRWISQWSLTLLPAHEDNIRLNRLSVNWIAIDKQAILSPSWGIRFPYWGIWDLHYDHILSKKTPTEYTRVCSSLLFWFWQIVALTDWEDLQHLQDS